MIEHRYSPHGFLHLQPLLCGLGDYISDGRQKREFLAALDLHDKYIDAAIIKMNEAHKEIEKAQQKIVSEIKSIFGYLVASSLNTESPHDAHCKRHAEIVVKDSPQLSVGQSSFEQQEAAPAPADTYVQQEAEQTMPDESVQEEATPATLPTFVQQEATQSVVDARAHQEIAPPATSTLVQHELTQPATTTFVQDEVALPAAGTQQIIGSSDAMKDGVASCDVEKDDVASCDYQEDVAGTNLK
ncbi:hypothetical protein GUJ93_ZPchr0010g10564 [Zizania palustris]|uniref:Uncharacterized protein n=1 Tax=Zizania palustris TaxID=103762 RepID=A0A8J5W7Q2_ZIZPA|nr:hypothetical protein GUJ93_ZPchr0010g10564 [Zizania palustris]